MKKLILAAIPAALLWAQSAHAAAPNEFIEVFQQLFGEQKGVRKGHAKGVCAVGEFTASSEAAKFNSPLLSGATVPAVIRFSMAGGNPNVPDYARSPRGLAAKFSLADGSQHTIATLTTPVFGAKNPENFLGLLRASLPGADGKADAIKIAAFRAANPDTQPQAAWLAANTPPWSYATAAYHGVHTFYLNDANGKPQKIRWHLAPRDGVKGLSAAELAEQNGEFLDQRLADRLAAGPVQFDWLVALGQPADSVDDPSIAWPERPTVNIGTLTITASGDSSCSAVNFDPNIMAQGFSASDDPVLKMRSPAYAISFGKRLSGQ